MLFPECKKMDSKFIRYLLLLVFISPTGLLDAQNSRVVIGFQSGVSFPLGYYASKSLGLGSFALPGWNASLNADVRIFPKLGIRLKSDFYLHPVDVTNLANEKVIADPFISQLVIRSEPYRLITVAAGPQIRKEIYQWLQFQGYLGMGVMWGRTPYQLYKPVYFLTGPPYYEITSSHSHNIMVEGSTGMRIAINPYTGILMNGGMKYSRMHYGFYSAAGYRVDVRTVWLFDITAGLSWSF